MMRHAHRPDLGVQDPSDDIVDSRTPRTAEKSPTTLEKPLRLRLYKAFRHAVYFEVLPDKEEESNGAEEAKEAALPLARLLPASAFVARSHNVAAAALSKPVMEDLFSESEFLAIASPVLRESKVTFVGDNTVLLPGVAPSAADKDKEKEERQLKYAVVAAWTGKEEEEEGSDTLPEGPEDETSAVEQFRARLEASKCRHLRDGAHAEDREPLPAARWHLTTYWAGEKARGMPVWPVGHNSESNRKPAKVAELLRPHGALLKMKDKDKEGNELEVDVYMHRSRFLVNSKQLPQTAVLEEFLAVGDDLMIHAGSNTDPRMPHHVVFDHCPTEKICFWAQKGPGYREMHELPKFASEKFLNQHMGAGRGGNTANKVRIVSFLSDPSVGGGKVSAALGVILPSLGTEPEQINSPIGATCLIPAHAIFLFGINLKDADLSRIFRLGDEVLGNIAYDPHHNLLHEYANAWKPEGLVPDHVNFRVTHASFVRMAKDNTSFGKVPFVNAASTSVLVAMTRKCFSLPMMENLLYGWSPSRVSTTPEGYAPASVVRLLTESPNSEEPVTRGEVKILLGPHQGRVLQFDRSAVEVFGHWCSKADLGSFLTPFDRLLAKVDGLGPEDAECQRVVLERADVTSPDPSQMTAEMRDDFLLWLTFKGLSFDEFQAIIRGEERSPPPFVPYSREQHGAVFTELCGPGTEDEEEAEAEGDGEDAKPDADEEAKPDVSEDGKPRLGMTYGFCEVVSGWRQREVAKGGQLMQRTVGEKVLVHRSRVWVYGKRLDKADLAYLIAPGQKLNMELEEIERDRALLLYPDVKEDDLVGVYLHAVVSWIGPARPQNKKENANMNDTGVYDWLLKRNLNEKSFAKLCAGEMAPTKRAQRGEQGFMLKSDILFQKRKGDEMFHEDGKRQMMDMPMGPMGGPDMMNGPPMGPGGPPGVPPFMTLPVLRHGKPVSEMLEGAIMASGPADPLLQRLIFNDDLAQKAHHVSQALSIAVKQYKERKMSMSGQGGGAAGGGFAGYQRPGGAAPGAGYNGKQQGGAGGVGNMNQYDEWGTYYAQKQGGGGY